MGKSSDVTIEKSSYQEKKISEVKTFSTVFLNVLRSNIVSNFMVISKNGIIKKWERVGRNKLWLFFLIYIVVWIPLNLHCIVDSSAPSVDNFLHEKQGIWKKNEF